MGAWGADDFADRGEDYMRRLADFVVRWPWVVIGAWIAIAVALPLSFPSLNEMAEKHPLAILPSDAPSAVTARKMTEAFHEAGSEDLLLVVLTDDKGLTPADEATYRALADTLRKDTGNVVMLQDFISTPPLKSIVTSKDNKAWVLPVGVAGELGTPRSYEAFNQITDTVKHTVAGSSLTANLTGPAGTVADLTVAGQQDRMPIELAIGVLVLIVLLIVYRSAITMLLPLIIDRVVAGDRPGDGGRLLRADRRRRLEPVHRLSERDHGRRRNGLRRLPDQPLSRLSALGRDPRGGAQEGVVLDRQGDRRVCQHRRHHLPGHQLRPDGHLPDGRYRFGDRYRRGIPGRDDLVARHHRARRPRGWVKPRRELTARFWRRSGIRIVRRPRLHLVASLLVLAALASCAGLVRYNYDDRKALGASAPSSIGYTALDHHFPVNQSIPEYLFIQSPRDLRNPQALADLEQMADRVSQLPNVAAISGITRPTGNVPEQFRATYQAGAIGSFLAGGSTLINDHTNDLNQLSEGSVSLADKLDEVRGQVAELAASVQELESTFTSTKDQYSGETLVHEVDLAAQLIDHVNVDRQRHGLELHRGQEPLRVDPPGGEGAARATPPAISTSPAATPAARSSSCSAAATRKTSTRSTTWPTRCRTTRTKSSSRPRPTRCGRRSRSSPAC